MEKENLIIALNEFLDWYVDTNETVDTDIIILAVNLLSALDPLPDKISADDFIRDFWAFVQKKENHEK